MSNSLSRICDNVQLCLKQIAIRVQRIQLRVHAAAISNVGEPHAVLQRTDQRLLPFAAFANPLVRNQTVRYLGERSLNRPLIFCDRAFPLGFR